MPDVPRSYVIPAWADPQQASVTDSNLTKALRWIGSVIGADSPSAQVLATLTPMDVGEGGGVIGAVQRFIKAYHGSPFDFDRFSSAHIGTGEGAQVYSRGLYVAENPATGAYYKMPDHPALGTDPRDDVTAIRHNWQAAGTKAMTPEIASSLMQDYPSLKPFAADPYIPINISRYVNGHDLGTDTVSAEGMYALRALDKQLPPKPTGHMYEVAIHSDPDHFLDWDKPLNQQSPYVQQALEKMGVPVQQEDWSAPHTLQLVNGQWTSPDVPMTSPNAGVAYRNLLEQAIRSGPAKPATVKEAELVQRMNDAGIAGVKYFDAGSRAAGEGTRNYVIYDDKTIEILKKYGVLLPLAGGAAVTATQQPGAQQ